MERQKLFSQVDASTAARQDSLLLRLPSEIRNAIYELVLSGLYITIPKFYGKNYHGSNPIGLLLTCKRIHAEAIQVYYASATFHFKSYPLENLEKWTKGIGPARTALVKNVRFTRHRSLDETLEVVSEVSDEWVRDDAKRAQSTLDYIQKSFGLSPGVVSIDLSFSGHDWWTKSPVEAVEKVLNLTTFVEYSGQYWIDEPSLSSRRKLPGAYTL